MFLLGIRTRDRRMVDADGSTELWRTKSSHVDLDKIFEQIACWKFESTKNFRDVLTSGRRHCHCRRCCCCHFFDNFRTSLVTFLALQQLPLLLKIIVYSKVVFQKMDCRNICFANVNI